MIKPHGSETLMPLYIADDAARAALQNEAAALTRVLVSSATAANAVMLGGAYFTPLEGYMTKADALSVARNLTTASGVFFPVPVLNLLANVDGLAVGQKIALLDPNVDGNPVIAVQTITAIDEFTDAEIAEIAEQV